MFEIPGSEILAVHVTEDAVNGRCAPTYVYAPSADAAAAAAESSSDNAAAFRPEEEELGQARAGRG